MRSNRGSVWLPWLLITLGVAWLLSTLGFVPKIDWLWTLGLAVVGLLTLATGGINKFSIVVGPFFLLASLLSVLRQTGLLTLNLEVPVLLIAVGLLMLVARLESIPSPRWRGQEPEKREPGK